MRSFSGSLRATFDCLYPAGYGRFAIEYSTPMRSVLHSGVYCVIRMKLLFRNKGVVLSPSTTCCNQVGIGLEQASILDPAAPRAVEMFPR